MILVVDFGSQTAQLIERRLKDFGATTLFLPPENILEEIKKTKPDGIILSGGPASVYGQSSPTIDLKVFTLGIPILAICYGMQLMMHLLGGKVLSGKKEYGPSRLKVTNRHRLLQEVEAQSTVWMSHGDEVVALPNGFETLASTDHVEFACVADSNKKYFGMLFHPEVEHTEEGDRILRNFTKMTGTEINEKKILIEPLIEQIRQRVGNEMVIGAVSGGVDSTVAAALTAKAIGKNFFPFYIENGLMREGTAESVRNIFKHVGVKVDIVRCEKEMMRRLKNVSDPERKRKIIGNFYIEMFEKEVKKLQLKGKKITYLLQGTIYSDVIESKGTKHASKIKSHHNVGGLPKNMKLKLLEPVKTFYKDEVRQIGRILGIPEEFVSKQPFPGPGFAVRIRGEVTNERLKKERVADRIVLEELEKAGLLSKIFISFPVMTGSDSTAVKGDGRFFGEVVALRVVESRDVMTSKWSHLPYDVLQSISSRIVNEVPGISRVVYDITTKPPATMEWE